MNSAALARLYNCSASALGRNISLLLMLNRTDLLTLLEDVFDKSTQREKLRDIISDCLFGNQERPFDLLWWQKFSWSLIFAVIIVISAGGNVIVMWIVLAHRRMRTVTNYFLVNLSLTDLMMSLLNCAFNFVFLVNSNWPFGVVYCTINNFVAHVTVASSVFTLVVISFDRYLAIMRPLKHRMSRKRAVAILLFIWSVSCVLAIPCLLYSTTSSRGYSNGKIRIACYLSWPDGGYLNSRSEYAYNLVFLGVTYIVPMTIMGVSYFLMGRKLWGSKSIGELTQYQRESMKLKRKVVKMFIIVVTIFAVCWLPYQGFFVLVYHYRQFVENSYVQHVYLTLYWLAMSNATVNPIIYYWMNNRFRVYFQLVLCKCNCTVARSSMRNRQMQELTRFPRSDLVRCQSGCVRNATSQWRQSTAESRIDKLKANARSICEKLQSDEEEAAL